MRSLLIFIIVLMPVLAMGKEGLKDPYQSYQDGQYDQALEGFVDQQVEHPTNPQLFVNLGSAHYEMKNYPEAEKAFNQAALLGDEHVRQQAFYNLGNTAYRLGKLDQAINWYKQALELNPSDEDTKFNLEFARDEIRRRHEEDQKRQKEQEKKQQNQCQQKKPDQQQEQDQQQDQKQPEQNQQPDKEEKKNSPEQNQQQPKPDQQKQSQPQNAGVEKEKKQSMTPEEAKHYLQGLSEDRKKHLKKQRARLGSRGRPAKDW